MHDHVFQNQSEWSGKSNASSVLLDYGARLGLDQAAYQACLDQHQTAARIQADMGFASSLGINGTPFFVINSGGALYAINGAIPYESFAKGLDGLLQGNPQ